MISITTRTTEHCAKLYTLSVTEDNKVLYTTNIEIGAVPQDGLQDKLAKTALMKQMLNEMSLDDVMRELANLIPMYNE